MAHEYMKTLGINVRGIEPAGTYIVQDVIHSPHHINLHHDRFSKSVTSCNSQHVQPSTEMA